MKFKNLKTSNLDEFFDVIDQCKGKVELISDDLQLNLKSNLAHYVSLARLMSADAKEIEELQIVAHEKEDIERLFTFMTEVC